MKQINDYIIEKLKINKNSEWPSNDCKDPEIGEIAYDYFGEEWEILAFCRLCEKKNLNSIISNYDDSGVFKDMLEDIKSEYDNNTFIVAAESDRGDSAVWVWGGEGLCYENKPKK